MGYESGIEYGEKGERREEEMEVYLRNARQKISDFDTSKFPNNICHGKTFEETLEPFEELAKAIANKSIKVDTLLRVWDESKSNAILQYFSVFNIHGECCCFAHGASSKTTDGDTEPWANWEVVR